MRPYRSITGPLVLILVGAIFLLHTISPNVRVLQLLTDYWPWILICWGVVGLIEASVQFSLNRPIPANGISGGGWFVVILICLAGYGAFQFHLHDAWWRNGGFSRGMQAFGEEHDFSVEPIQRPVGKTPRLVIENFRGGATINGADNSEITISGHKTIRALNSGDANQANGRTPVEVVMKGNTIVVRCNQDKSNSSAQVSTNLQISVPKGTSVEATGTLGDFDVSSLTGDIDISSENAGIRVQDIQGGVKLDTRKSDLIRCTDVRGTVDLRGHGTDIELTKIGGQVTVSGSFSGSVSLHDLAKPVKVENLRTEFNVQQIPGEVRLERGSISMENVVGPTRLSTRTTDVTLNNFTDGLELTADKGDIELRPGHLPLGRITVHTRSGNIDMSMPQSAVFAMKASTDRGEISNDFGGGLQARTDGDGARLEGSVGSGPDVNLFTNRGSITVRKTSGEGIPARMPEHGAHETKAVLVQQ